MRIARPLVVGGLALATLLGPAGIAHADFAAQEKEACRLMDEPDQGYAPAEYAFMTLRSKMSADLARDVMSQAAQDYCPNHIIDLPASWR
ncbi:hypothetical protein [Mycobacterium sp. Marseille-P9652]|uniref:hypothetical protein n=1 Tax=Mycobacterium sp. Marseille-P9652 TaxID=2654950 RepID=UPI001E624893|nr:hypothetical protein [Mycobacterium sp. Marseille-P9652]